MARGRGRKQDEEQYLEDCQSPVEESEAMPSIRDVVSHEGLVNDDEEPSALGQGRGQSGGGSRMPCNKPMPEREEKVLTQARASSDSEGLYVSESTVYHILKREGLIKPGEIVVLLHSGCCLR